MAEIKKAYQAKLNRLPCCSRLYLWLRMNWVQDILFRQSGDQLDDIVGQLYNGRTCIKSSLEIGLMNLAKRECQQAKEEEIQEKLAIEPDRGQKSKHEAQIAKTSTGTGLVGGEKQMTGIVEERPISTQ